MPTLFKDGIKVDGARYMLIDVGPNESCPFDLTKSKKIYPGSYRCLLEVLGPSGLLASETRQCQVIGQLTSDNTKGASSSLKIHILEIHG
jgi:hypothetical protein